MRRPPIAFLEEGLAIGRKTSVAILGVITATGSGFVIYFSANQTALNTVDFWVGTALIFVLAMIEVILFAWVYGVDKGYNEAQQGAELQIPRVWKFVIKYISPVYLVTVFVAWCLTNLPTNRHAAGRVRVYGRHGAVRRVLLVLHVVPSRRYEFPVDASTGHRVP